MYTFNDICINIYIYGIIKNLMHFHSTSLYLSVERLQSPSWNISDLKYHLQPAKPVPSRRWNGDDFPIHPLSTLDGFCSASGRFLLGSLDTFYKTYSSIISILFGLLTWKTTWKLDASLKTFPDARSPYQQKKRGMGSVHNLNCGLQMELSIATTPPKKMLVCSSTYRKASTCIPSLKLIAPENGWFED